MDQSGSLNRGAGPIMKPMRVAVIGAGASGLVTAKYLNQAREYFGVPRMEIRIFEREDSVGGVYRHKVYEEAEMVSSKYLTAFSDFRVAHDLPDFLPMADYVRYLEGYCSQFDLWDLIETRTEITSVYRTPTGHRVFFRRMDEEPNSNTRDETGQGETWDCDAIAVCSGLNNVPSIPAIQGLDGVQTLHSSGVKERQQFGTNTSVMILGAGETAMDLAHLAVTSRAREVILCHKDGFFCAKKTLPLPVVMKKWKPDPRQKPVDTAIASFLDTAYLPERLQHSQLPWSVYDKTMKFLHFISGGTVAGPDQWVGGIEGDRNNVDSLFLVKSDRALPYLNEGHRAQDIFSRVRAFLMNVELKDTGGKRILTAPWPLCFSKDGTVAFPESENPEHAQALSKVMRPDLVVLATGYVRRFSFLGEDYPKPDELDVRGIWRRGDVTAGFIGFVRPGIGAIPPLAELQAQLWVLNLVRHQYPQQVPMPSSSAPGQGAYPDAVGHYEVDYALKARGGHDFFKTKHGVEQESYAYQLALDMGAAPTMSFMARQGFRAFFTWAMGSNFNTKFRLVGPWKWQAGALSIMRGELFQVVSQTGGGVFFMSYTLFPLLLFGALTGILHAAAGFLRLLGMEDQARKVLGSGNVPRREGDGI